MQLVLVMVHSFFYYLYEGPPKVMLHNILTALSLLYCVSMCFSPLGMIILSSHMWHPCSIVKHGCPQVCLPEAMCN
jgi:hypothetical protein